MGFGGFESPIVPSQGSFMLIVHILRASVNRGGGKLLKWVIKEMKTIRPGLWIITS